MAYITSPFGGLDLQILSCFSSSDGTSNLRDTQGHPTLAITCPSQTYMYPILLEDGWTPVHCFKNSNSGNKLVLWKKGFQAPPLEIPPPVTPPKLYSRVDFIECCGAELIWGPVKAGRSGCVYVGHPTEGVEVGWAPCGQTLVPVTFLATSDLEFSEGLVCE